MLVAILQADMIVLEIGFGTGVFTEQIASRLAALGGGTLIGLDHSEYALDKVTA